jgi:hypothetical protein
LEYAIGQGRSDSSRLSRMDGGVQRKIFVTLNFLLLQLVAVQTAMDYVVGYRFRGLLLFAAAAEAKVALAY